MSLESMSVYKYSLAKMSEDAKSLNDIENFIRENTQYINWVELDRVLKQHKIENLFYQDMEHLFPKSEKSRIAYWRLQNELVSQTYLVELNILRECFESTKIDFILLKGFSIGYKVYDDLFVRHMHDIDILLMNGDQLNEAQSVLEDLGYKCYHKNADYKKSYLPKGVRIKHHGFHECEYRKNLSNEFRLKVEIHLDTGSIGPDIIDCFKRDIDYAIIGNNSFKIMNDEHFFIYLCANLYENNETNHGAYNNTYLRDYIDVMRSYHKFKSRLDACKIARLSKEYNIFHKMCRVFYLLQQFETVVLSPEWKREFSICNIKNRDVYGSGAVVDWRSSIVDRFFSIEDRRKEYSDLYIRRIFSEINPNFASRVDLRKEKAIICFHNEECGQDFLVEFKEKNNVFEIAFDNLEPLLEGRYELVFSFLHSQEKAISMNGNPMSLLVIQKDQQGEFSAVDIEGNVQGQCDFDKKNNRIRIRIPLESLYLFDRMIAYNILLRERVYQNYFRWCGGLYENYNPKGNLGILIV